MKSGKVWGETFDIDNADAVKICYMNILPNMRCSLHLHPAVYNGFFVFSGRLWIEVHKTDYALVDVTELGPLESMIVKYGEKHVFVTKDEPCQAIEWYRGERGNCSDIVRDNVGGKSNKDGSGKDFATAMRETADKIASLRAGGFAAGGLIGPYGETVVVQPANPSKYDNF